MLILTVRAAPLRNGDGPTDQRTNREPTSPCSVRHLPAAGAPPAQGWEHNHCGGGGGEGGPPRGAPLPLLSPAAYQSVVIRSSVVTIPEFQVAGMRCNWIQLLLGPVPTGPVVPRRRQLPRHPVTWSR
eukprot:gene10499-biopygen22821